MAYNNKETPMKAKMDKNQPLPKGDKYHYYPKGLNANREGYPDMPSEVQACQDRNVKAINKDKWGKRN